MRWRKLGRVFAPSGDRPWAATHAAVPTAEPLGDGRFRVYYSGRDARQRSHVGSFDFDPRRPGDAVEESPRPWLAPGPLGRFDEDGAMLSWIATAGDEARFYYIGWNLAGSVPFRNSLGMAVRRDGGPIERVHDGPVLDRGIHDPCFVASACVLPDDGAGASGGGWRMWYLSCVTWERDGERLRHRYHIKYATSADGIDWRRDGRVCIDFASDAEYAISRPCVIRDGDLYRMWYSYRGDRYRIGYAESKDGLAWTRKDGEAGIEPSADGWDAGMIEYPFVFDSGGERYLLYNGDGYGRTGIGLAVLERD